MEKFGVLIEEDDKSKTATDRKSCPSCGCQLRSLEHTGVPLCPNCGTKPFEK